MRTFQNEMVSSSSTTAGVDDADVDDILCDIVTTTAKKRVCVVASKRTGVVSFLLEETEEEETEEEREESIHGKCFGERERSNNRLTTLIASAMSDGGVVALLGDANGDVWCARCDDTVRGCVVDKCERREGPELTVGSEYDYSSTPRKGGGSGGEGGGIHLESWRMDRREPVGQEGSGKGQERKLWAVGGRVTTGSSKGVSSKDVSSKDVSSTLRNR